MQDSQSSATAVWVRPAPVWPRAVMRAVVTLLAAAVFVQPALGGQFLAGDFDLLVVHATVGDVILLLVVLQLVAAILLRWPGRGPWWPMPASAAMFPMAGMQIGMGYERNLAVHVPLGVALVAISLLLVIWAWLPADGRR